MDRFSRKEKHPHAHTIHQPGKRLMRNVPLRYVFNLIQHLAFTRYPARRATARAERVPAHN